MNKTMENKLLKASIDVLYELDNDRIMYRFAEGKDALMSLRMIVNEIQQDKEKK